MDHAHPGRTGLKVSRLALGTMNFGEVTNEATSFAIVDEALNPGIKFFDTADIHGGPQSPGLWQNLKAPSLRLSGEVLARLDEIWPGPGGEAPVADAW